MVGELVASEEELRYLESNKYHDHETIGQSFVYCRKKFSVSYNGDKVIEVNLTSEDPQPVQEGQVMQFQYEVKWTPTQKIALLKRDGEEDLLPTVACGN